MEFLFELLFGIFFEMPLEMAMESKRLKPWVKTAIIFVVFNLLTVLMVVIAFDLYHDPEAVGGWQIGAGFAVMIFAASLYICITGHRRAGSGSGPAR